MSKQNEIDLFESQSPWLDRTGRHLGLQRLRRSSRNWTPNEWEAYLSHLETPLRESLLRNFDSFIKDREVEAPNYFFKEDEPLSSNQGDSSIRLRRAVKKLTPTQQKVVHLIFWNGLSERKAAKKMGLSRFSIQTHLARAISHLRELLSSSLPIVEGQKTSNDPRLWLFRAIRASKNREREPSQNKGDRLLT